MNVVTWKLDVLIKDGPRVSLTEDSLNLDAYDRIEVEVKGSEDSMRVEIQPNDISSTLRLLLMVRTLDPKAADKPGPDQLAYRVNGEGEWIPLYNHQVILGYGTFNLLKAVPKWLEFRNQHKTPANVLVLVGRNMPPEPEPPPPPEAETPDQVQNGPEVAAAPG